MAAGSRGTTAPARQPPDPGPQAKKATRHFLGLKFQDSEGLRIPAKEGHANSGIEAEALACRREWIKSASQRAARWPATSLCASDTNGSTSAMTRTALPPVVKPQRTPSQAGGSFPM